MRDSVVTGLIKHFEDPRLYLQPQNFSKSDFRAVEREVERCQDSFEYTARNYLYIVNKDRQDILLDLWPSQEIILDRMHALKARGRAQRIQVIKARQIGCSHLVEGLGAWKMMFFPNQNGLVVADVDARSTYLFGLMLHMYENLPWWLKPLVRAKKYEEGLHFANPDTKTPGAPPGLNSKVFVSSAKDLSGVGTGFTLTFCHASEYSLWDEVKAKEIIAGQMRYALVESPETIGVLESTAKGARRFAHKLWKSNVELGEKADWEPVFIPYFFEKRYVLSPERGWRPEQDELDLREKAKRDWMTCPKCGVYRQQVPYMGIVPGVECNRCKQTNLVEMALTDAQLCYIWNLRINARQQDEEALMNLKENMCVAGDMRIATDLGILPISSASGASSVETGSVKRWLSNGSANTITVKTKFGRRLTCTPDHKILLADGAWKEAGSLCTGDRLVLSPPVLAKDHHIAEWDGPISTKRSLPISDDFGRLMGYFMGDGCHTGMGIRIACTGKDLDVVEDVRYLLKKFSGSEPLVEVRGGLTEMSSNNKGWHDIMHSLGCLRPNGRATIEHSVKRGYIRNVHVPDCIWKSPKSVVRGFLSALFESDGHAYRGTPRTSLCTKWPEFARDVQLLLLSFGINARVKSYVRSNSKKFLFNTNDVGLYGEASNRFHSEIGFIGQRKRTTGLIRSRLNTLGFLNEMEDEVEAIEDAGVREVFDLDVPGQTRYGANGIMVHNCCTAEEAFQSFGVQSFPDVCHTFVARTVTKPIAIGFFDQHGDFHGVRNYDDKAPDKRHCFQDTCKVDHSFDACDLKIWEWPVKGAAYVAGVDVASGMGGNRDYSAIVVNRVSSNGAPDMQVMSYRSNSIDPRAFAAVVNTVGKMYNEALLAIEYNLPECANYVTQYYQYPNLYRWLYLDATTNIRSNRFHWVTNEKTKKRLWMTTVSFLKQRLWVVKDETIAAEMKTYVEIKPGEEKFAAAAGDHDDLLTAGMIAVVCAHETDVSSGESSMKIPLAPSADPEGDFKFSCAKCGYEWSGMAHNHYIRCTACSSAYISVKRKTQELNVATIDWDERASADEVARRMAPPQGWQGSVDSVNQSPYDSF